MLHYQLTDIPSKKGTIALSTSRLISFVSATPCGTVVVTLAAIDNNMDPPGTAVTSLLSMDCPLN